MTGPAWIPAGLAALMLLLAGLSAGRMVASKVRRRQTEFDADGVHILMGIAMAGMFEPRLSPLPAGLWQAAFAAAAAWFAWQGLHASDDALSQPASRE